MIFFSRLMNSKIIGLIFLLSILIVITPISLISYSAETTGGYQVLYQKYISGMLSQQSGLTTSTVYLVLNSTASINSSDGKGTVKTIQHGALYSITSLGKAVDYKGYVNISVENGLILNLKTNIPYLARVLLTEGNFTQLVWAGFNSTIITSYVYINSSANLVLQFLNGSKFVSLTFTITSSSSVSKSVTLRLEEISVKINLLKDSQTVIQLNYPRKYAPYISSSEINGSYINVSSKGMNVVQAYFNGTLLPAIIWKGEGKGSFSLTSGLIHSSLDIDTEFQTISFYGVNGTPVAYVHEVYLTGTLSQQGPVKAIYGDLKAGELKIVKVIGAKYSKPSSAAKAYVNGTPVIVIITDKGEVESTADINVIHKVYVNNTAGVIVNIYINGTGKVIIVTKNNQASNVSIVAPKSVNVISISIAGKSYFAQNITVQAPSKYIMFNVSLINSSTTIQVYKVVNGNLVQLNSSNYFIMNGKLVIFDDPENNYLVVYGATTPITQTTSSVSSIATTTQQQSGGMGITSGGISSNLLYIIIGIIIVVVILAIAIVISRRK